MQESSLPLGVQDTHNYTCLYSISKHGVAGATSMHATIPSFAPIGWH